MSIEARHHAISERGEHLYVCGLLQIDVAPHLIQATLRERCAGVRFTIEPNKAGGDAQHRVMLDRSVHISRDQADSAWQCLRTAAITEWPEVTISAARKMP